VPAARRLRLGTIPYLNRSTFPILGRRISKVRQRPSRSLEMATSLPWERPLCYNVWLNCYSYLICLAYTRSWSLLRFWISTLSWVREILGTKNRNISVLYQRGRFCILDYFLSFSVAISSPLADSRASPAHFIIFNTLMTFLGLGWNTRAGLPRGFWNIWKRSNAARRI